MYWTIKYWAFFYGDCIGILEPNGELKIMRKMFSPGYKHMKTAYLLTLSGSGLSSWIFSIKISIDNHLFLWIRLFYKYIWNLVGLPLFNATCGGGRTRGDRKGKSLSTVTMCPFPHSGQRSTSFPVRVAYRCFQSIDLRVDSPGDWERSSRQSFNFWVRCRLAKKPK